MQSLRPGLITTGVCAAVAILFTALTTGATAQAHPDFSGRWSLDAAAPQPGAGRGAAVRADMGSGWGPALTIAQDAAHLTVEYALYARSDMQPPLTFVFALDGSETRTAVMTGQATDVERSHTSWDGAILVITTSQSFVDPATGKTVPVDVTRRLSLSAPDALVVETTRAGVLGGPPSSTRSVYKKS